MEVEQLFEKISYLPLEIIDLIFKNEKRSLIWFYYYLKSNLNENNIHVFKFLLKVLNFQFSYEFSDLSFQKKTHLLLDMNLIEGYFLWRKLPILHTFLNIRYHLFSLYKEKIITTAFELEDMEVINSFADERGVYPFIIENIFRNMNSEKKQRLRNAGLKATLSYLPYFLNPEMRSDENAMYYVRRHFTRNEFLIKKLHQVIHTDDKNWPYKMGFHVSTGKHFDEELNQFDEIKRNILTLRPVTEQNLDYLLHSWFAFQKENINDLPINYYNLNLPYQYGLLFSYNGINIFKKYEKNIILETLENRYLNSYVDYSYWIDLFDLQCNAERIRKNYEINFGYKFTREEMFEHFGVIVDE